MSALGGYSDVQQATAEELEIFSGLKAQISAEVNGSELTATGEVRKQIVNGHNYSFGAKDASGKAYVVVIYKKGPWDGGEASLTSVTAQ